MAKEKKIKKTPVAKKDKNTQVYGTTFGRYGTLSRVTAEAEQFMHHDVFVYRSAIFPNPVAFRVVVKMLEATAVERHDVHPLYKFAIHIKIAVSGEANDRIAWIRSMEDRLRARH